MQNFVLYLFKIRYIGLYFWSDSSTAKKRAEETVVGDVFGFVGIILAVVVLILLKFKIIPPSLLKGVPNARYIILISLGIICLFFGMRMLKYFRSLINESDFKEKIDLNRYSKKSALPYFIHVILSPILFLFILGIIQKSVASFF